MLEINRNALRAFFYLNDAELPPDDVTNEWFLAPEPEKLSEERFESFCRQMPDLIDDLRKVEVENDEDGLQSAFYESAKAAFGTGKDDIREFFRYLYLVIFEKPQGARWGQFVALTGRDEFIGRLEERLNDPLNQPTSPEEAPTLGA